MNRFSKISKALEYYLNEVSKEKHSEILEAVKSLNIEGPSIGEYFSEVLQNHYYEFRLPKGTKFYGFSYKPPLSALKFIEKTSKFSLESFFITHCYVRKKAISIPA